MFKDACRDSFEVTNSRGETTTHKVIDKSAGMLASFPSKIFSRYYNRKKACYEHHVVYMRKLWMRKGGLRDMFKEYARRINLFVFSTELPLYRLQVRGEEEKKRQETRDKREETTDAIPFLSFAFLSFAFADTDASRAIPFCHPSFLSFPCLLAAGLLAAHDKRRRERQAHPSIFPPPCVAINVQPLLFGIQGNRHHTQLQHHALWEQVL